MILYLDTSSLVKLYFEEPGTPEVERLAVEASLLRGGPPPKASRTFTQRADAWEAQAAARDRPFQRFDRAALVGHHFDRRVVLRTELQTSPVVSELNVGAKRKRGSPEPAGEARSARSTRR